MNIRMDKRIDLRRSQFISVRIYERYERNINLQVGDAFYEEVTVKLTPSDAQQLIDILEAAIAEIHQGKGVRDG